MKRRQFVRLASFTATGGLIASVSPGLAAPDVPLQPDGVGSLARMGLLTPAFDPVPESEAWAMAPQGVSIHVSRVSTTRGDASSFAKPPHVDAAVELLAGVKPSVILYSYSSSSYLLGAQAEEALRIRLEAIVPGIPIVLAAIAASKALRALSVRRVAVVHPPWFTEEVNSKGGDYFRSRGFEVVSCARLAPLRTFAEVPPAEVYDWVKVNVPKQAEAVLIAGNGLRAVGVIQALEAALDKPVLTANQVTFWQALRTAGVTAPVNRYGQLFKRAAAQHGAAGDAPQAARP
jgi:maleate isomerase